MKSGILEEMQKPETMTPLQALILEDSKDDVELLLLYLRRTGFNVTHSVAENMKQFRAGLMEKDFDVVLSDYTLPGWTGLDAARELRGMGKDTPLLLVTGTLGEEAAVECIKHGVTDYILKDNLKPLPSALTRAFAEKALRGKYPKSPDALRVSEACNRDLVENSVYGILHQVAIARLGRSEEHTSELPSHLNIVCPLFFLNDTATTEIYTLPLHAALPFYF